MGRAAGFSVMKILIILNDAPYGSERTYNGLRLAGSLARQEGVELRVFLMGDAVVGSRRGQKTPSGYYNVQNMLVVVLRRQAAVGVCGSCMDARGIGDADLVEGAHRSSMDELTAWTLEAEKSLVF
jgi:uncharacterized protein involved in oxidation of intracellular sulfur